MGRVLAIDWGGRRTGLAVTDTLRISCNPLSTIPTNTLMDWLKTYTSQETVDEIVVGMALRLNGDDTHSTKPIIAFIEKLKSEINIPVFTIDERLSSKEAQYYIQNSGLKKNKRKEKGLVDSVSATIILQTHLSRI